MTKSFIIGGCTGLICVLTGWLTGCSSAEAPKTGGTTQGETKSPTDPAPVKSGTDPVATGDDTNCVAAGEKGNDKGVGAYCQASKDCTGDTFCTAGVAPKGAEFCTAFCTSDADCGAGASCYTDPRGRACVPAACIALQEKSK
jgi:hypothetical protein